MIEQYSRRMTFVAIACVISACLADFLFYEQPVGWTAGAYLFFIVMCLAMRKPWLLVVRHGAVLFLAMIGLSVALVLRAGWLAMTLYGCALMTFALCSRGSRLGNALDWPRKWSQLLTKGMGALPNDLGIAKRWMSRAEQQGRKPRGVVWMSRTFVLTWLVPVLLCSIFVILFAFANPIVEIWVKELTNILARIPRVTRIAMWTIIFVVSWALLRARDRRREADLLLKPPPLPSKPQDDGLACAIVTRSLVLFNIVFAIENILDARYLSGLCELPTGMTYASYAHRGAYPLVLTAILAGCFILAAFGPKGVATRSKTAKWLVYLWIVQNVVLTASSLWRLQLYVGVYSLTRLRVNAGIWMLLVALGLIWIGMRIVLQRDNTWLVNANVLTLLIVLFTCCFVDFDHAIASHNVRHCREVGGKGVTLDIKYLEHLGVEAAPALVRFAGETGSSKARDAAGRLKRKLKTRSTNWRAWTVSQRLLVAELGLLQEGTAK